jgi:cytosine/adenosine deaminase-related metal-dependent hydrolase
LIENGKISQIYPTDAHIVFPDNTKKVDTKGIILPGLVDVHNHLSYNVFERWSVGPLKFNNRYQWRYHSAVHKQDVALPHESIQADHLCEMNMYGEIRALTGGTTSVVSEGPSCIRGLVRNLGDQEQVEQKRIDYLIDIKNHDPSRSDAVVDNKLDAAKNNLEAGKLDGFFIHLAEGKANDPVTRQEFSLLQSKGLLTSKTSIVHGISLGASEFETMRQAGASLVWSPSSNIELYGETANIIAARGKKLRIAIAPDWSITGSNTMLEELRFAKQWAAHRTPKLFTHKELFEMATSIPAAMAGLADKIGSIKPGFYADLLIIEGTSADPYLSLAEAKATDIKLVIVNGTALYGRQNIMEQFYSSERLEVLLQASHNMVIRKPVTGNINSFDELRDLLTGAMTAHGLRLAPLFDVATIQNLPKPVINKEKKTQTN